MIIAVSCLYWCSACIQVGRFGLVTLPSDCTSFSSSVLAPMCILNQDVCASLPVSTVIVPKLQRYLCCKLYLACTQVNRVCSWKNNRMSVKVLYKPCSSTTLSRWTVIHGFHVAASWLPRSDELFNRLSFSLLTLSKSERELMYHQKEYRTPHSFFRDIKVISKLTN